MKYRKALFCSLFAATLFLVSGCFDPPEFSEIPEIKFHNLKFVEVENSPDTLLLSFEFQDGNGDLGLHSDEDNPPYQPFWQVLDSNNELIHFGDHPDSVALPLYILDPFDLQERRLYAETYIPPPFNCKDWFIHPVRGDTILIVENEWHKNIRINIFRKVAGEYEFINDQLSNGGCTEDFDARIPVFDQSNLNENRPLSGVINYAMLSQGFPIVFRNDTIKMEFYIYDLALNQSNIAETPDFVLDDIR